MTDQKIVRSTIQFQNEQIVDHDEYSHIPLYGSPFTLSPEDQITVQESATARLSIVNRIKAAIQSRGYLYEKIIWTAMIVRYVKPTR